VDELYGRVLMTLTIIAITSAIFIKAALNFSKFGKLLTAKLTCMPEY